MVEPGTFKKPQGKKQRQERTADDRALLKASKEIGMAIGAVNSSWSGNSRPRVQKLHAAFFRFHAMVTVFRAKWGTEKAKKRWAGEAEGICSELRGA